MLARQVFQSLDPAKPHSFELESSLLLAHFVRRLDGYARVFGAVRDEVDTSAWRQAAHDAFEHLARVGELVVGIDDPGEVDAARG